MAACFHIGGDAFLQALGLADIEDGSLRIQHPIDAGRVGKSSHIGLDPGWTAKIVSLVGFARQGYITHTANIYRLALLRVALDFDAG